MKKSKSDLVRNSVAGRFWSTALLVMHLMMQRFWEMIGGFFEVHTSLSLYLIFARNHSPLLGNSTFNSGVHEKRGGKIITTACSSLVCMEALYAQASMHACIFICFSVQLTSLFRTSACIPPIGSFCKLRPKVTGGAKVAEMRAKLHFSTSSWSSFEFSHTYDIITLWDLAKDCYFNLPYLSFDPHNTSVPAELNPVLEAGQFLSCVRKGRAGILVYVLVYDCLD